MSARICGEGELSSCGGNIEMLNTCCETILVLGLILNITSQDLYFNITYQSNMLYFYQLDLLKVERKL